MNEDKKTFKVSQEDIELAKKAAPADLREQEPVSIFNEILDWVESFVFAMFIIILIFIFLLRIVTVEGESMNATLDDKDRVIITHLNYTPKRDDVVVANSSVLNKTIIKRVIGVGGDTVKIDYNVNKVFVNGEEISNEHINGTMINKGMFDPNYLISDGVYQYKVPDGKVFVMGDNRNNSTDSRTIGFIDNKDVLGHVIFRLCPFKKLGKSNMKLVDAVVEITDARIPYSSRNPEIKKIVGSKPRLVLLNKADSADAVMTDRWIEYYKKQGVRAIATDCRSGKNVGKFYTELKAILKDDIAKWESKGMTGRPIRLMIVGIPNVGKSSFINRLAGSKMAKVEDRPGVTKGKQWVSLDEGFELLDMPGVLWPKFEDKLVGERLAFTGAVKDQIMDTEFLACRLLEFLKDNYNDLLEARYGITTGDIPPNDDETIGCVVGFEILERIGRKRGFLVSGGEINTQRAADTVLDEYRSGKIGRMTLEQPQ